MKNYKESKGLTYMKKDFKRILPTAIHRTPNEKIVGFVKIQTNTMRTSGQGYIKVS